MPTAAILIAETRGNRLAKVVVTQSENHAEAEIRDPHMQQP